MKGGKGSQMRATKTFVGALVAIHGAASAGCSFLYTKGPQPQLRPPPPCTTSNAAPIEDTVLGAASVGLAVAGGIVASS